MREQILLDNNYQWILNLEEKFEKQHFHLHNLQLFPHRMLISLKGENSYCTVEKMDKTLTW